MSSVKNYFELDFIRPLNLGGEITLAPSSSPASGFRIPVLVHWDFDANAKFVACLLPDHPGIAEMCQTILSNIETIISHVEGSFVINRGADEQEDWEKASSASMVFAGRVFFYLQGEITQDLRKELVCEAKEKSLYPIFRAGEYIEMQKRISPPQAFISYSSEDRETIARPIAVGLHYKRVSVWYDEFQLNVGASIRESIERGIRECRYCILIVSKHMLSNQRYARKEFEAIFSKEVIEKRDAVLPIWVDVTPEDVYAVSPTLAGRVSLSWDRGEDFVVDTLAQILSKPTVRPARPR